MRSLATLCLVLAAALGSLGGACDRVARKHPLTLESDVFELHKAIREARWREATAYILPEFREQFVREWERASILADFQDLEVLSVKRSEDVEYAHVDAKLTYISKTTLSVKEHRVFELWKGEGTAWFLAAPLPPPPVGADPATLAPAAPVPAAPPLPPARAGDDAFGGGTP